MAEVLRKPSARKRPMDVKEAVQALQSAVLEGREQVRLALSRAEAECQQGNEEDWKEESQRDNEHPVDRNGTGLEELEQGESQVAGMPQFEKLQEEQRVSQAKQQSEVDATQKQNGGLVGRVALRKDVHGEGEQGGVGRRLLEASQGVKEQEKETEKGGERAAEGIDIGAKETEDGVEIAKWREAGRKRAWAEERKIEEGKVERGKDQEVGKERKGEIVAQGEKKDEEKWIDDNESKGEGGEGQRHQEAKEGKAEVLTSHASEGQSGKESAMPLVVGEEGDSGRQTEGTEKLLQGSDVARQLREDDAVGGQEDPFAVSDTAQEKPGEGRGEILFGGATKMAGRQAGEETKGERPAGEAWKQTVHALSRRWTGAASSVSEFSEEPDEQGFDELEWARKGKAKVENDEPVPVSEDVVTRLAWQRTEQLIDERWGSNGPNYFDADWALGRESAAAQIAEMADFAQAFQVSKVGETLATAVGSVLGAARDAALGWKERLEDARKKADDPVHAPVAQGLEGLGDGLDAVLEETSIGAVGAVKATAGALVGLQERAQDALGNPAVQSVEVGGSETGVHSGETAWQAGASRAGEQAKGTFAVLDDREEDNRYVGLHEIGD
jgi:hypothetical protein